MGRIWVGVTCCGKAERILEMATEWAATCKQFGKPIGSFQATGFRLADGAISLRAADLMVQDAVERAEKGIMSDPDAAMIKVICSEIQHHIITRSILRPLGA